MLHNKCYNTQQQSQYSVWRLPFMAIIQTPHVQTNWIDHIYTYKSTLQPGDGQKKSEIQRHRNILYDLKQTKFIFMLLILVDI